MSKRSSIGSERWAGAAGGVGGVGGAAAAGGAAATGGVGGNAGSGGDSGSGASGGSDSGGSAGAAGGGSGGSAGASDAGADAQPGACTREGLKALVDQYFVALAAHSSASLPLAPTVKFTENGDVLEVGKGGLWANAGTVKFKHSAFDTETCSTLTESVVPDCTTDIPFGLRLKLEAQKITEIETIAVRRGDYFVSSNTGAIIATQSENWEALVPAGERDTRQKLQDRVDVYFKRFPAGACDFASNCRRLENGSSPGTCSLGLSCSTSGSGSMGMTPSRFVIDVEAGIGGAFVMFVGSYTDFHMFKVSGAQVRGVHAILASATSSGWN